MIDRDPNVCCVKASAAAGSSRTATSSRPQSASPVEASEIKKIKRDQCLKLDSRFLHNHPSGDPKPSRDIEMTGEIKAASEALSIAIHDHLVIGRKGHASFRSLGLLT